MRVSEFAFEALLPVGVSYLMAYTKQVSSIGQLIHIFLAIAALFGLESGSSKRMAILGFP